MKLLKYIVVNIVETLLRFLPVPCKTVLIRIGNPNRNSPVFLTCNYHLTVERVKKALKGIDCYLLVANSNGINVWCAATGGHLTNHSVISALKTSKIEELVDHRNLILPQLAATGIESRVIQEKTGWKVIWGPVYAKDISTFIKNGFKKTSEISQVRFPLGQRIEMAAMWAFPFSVIATLIMIPVWSKMIIPLNIFFWVFSSSIFIGFPLYSKWLNPEKKMVSFSKYTILFDFARVPLLLWGIFLSLLILYSILTDTFTLSFISQWSVISLIILLLLCMDLMGSTPIYKSSLHGDRYLKVSLDEGKCKGAGFCEQVCPKNCFKVDKERHIARLPRAEQCVQCGACIVQCPFDALSFKNPKDEIITPETIRKFKLNLIGRRLVRVERN